jgi:hypothetical protein
MKFNPNIVRNILETQFPNEVDDYVIGNLQNFDVEEIETEFDYEPTTIELSAVVYIDVQDDIETETTADNTTLVSGTAVLDVEVDGFDEERMNCGSTTVSMVYSYSFEVDEKGKFHDLYMEWVD